MSETITRKEVLDLLARGKIGIDEAVDLLEQVSQKNPANEGGKTPVFKAEIPADEAEKIEKIKVEETANIEPVKKVEEDFKEDLPAVKKKDPRWLRVRVNKLDTGKNKVAVNIPFGMVKFGLGIAQRFNPEIDGVDLEQISEEMTKAEPGVIVEVEDAESNEQVRIYFE